MPKVLDSIEFERLRKIRQYIPDSMIAGGSVRDYLFGKPYSDVDIFLPQTNPLFEKYGTGYFFEELLPEIFDEDVEVSYNESSSYDPRRIYQVYSLEDSKKNKYQFIFGDGNPLKSFDFNCCRVYYDGANVRKTPTYKEFDKTRILKFTREPSQFTNTSFKRLQKILDRYPEFSMDDITRNLYKTFFEKLAKPKASSRTYNWDIKTNSISEATAIIFDDTNF